MRYRVLGHEIRSENAAKPIAHASHFLREYIRQLPEMESALDYGCGKLRYAGDLATRVERLIVVDSEIQLGRVQRIAGRAQSVRDYVTSRWHHVEAQTVAQFEAGREMFDFALCANVLPLIPRRAHRYRVISLIASRLRPAGRCLFSAQYRNADFRGWAQKANATPYADGYVVLNPRGASFYGLINKESMERHAERGGMEVVESWTHGESAYVLARRAP